MPYYEVFSTRSDAMRREQEIKRKKSAKSIRAIIQHNLSGIDHL
jgi:predicted GIY-YIG superfamily endonuclease